MINFYKILMLFIVVASLFAACDNDDDVTSRNDEGCLILFGGSSSTGSMSWENGRIDTRANGTIPSIIPENLGVFAFGDAKNTNYIFKNQKVYNQTSEEYTNGQTTGGRFPWKHPENTWPYTIIAESPSDSKQETWKRMGYRFFAYSPYSEDQDVKVEAENYTGFKTFTWDNIPGFSSKDYVVSNNIMEEDNRRGEITTNKVVTFTMRHILSRIRFFFKMDKNYRYLRKIELNSITVLTAGRVKTATFNFTNNAWDETVHWSNEQPGEAAPVRLVNTEKEKYEIETEYPQDPYASVYVYPQTGFNSLKMKVNYTVYDSKGIATRNAEITNTIELPNWTLLSGYYYDININIVPDYLYVLSDNDQDFDGYVIIKDK